MHALNALSCRPFAWLWAGQTVSRFGDRLYQVALVWWIVEKAHSASASGLVAACAFVPSIVTLLIGGAIVDRLPRAWVMLLSDLLRCGLTLCMAGLVVTDVLTDVLTVWPVCLISALFGVVNAFFAPAYAALMPEVVPARLLPSANALTTLGAEVSGVLGPALGALVVGFGLGQWAFFLDAASFLVSAMCLLPSAVRGIGTRGEVAAPAHHGDLLQDVCAGFSVVRKSGWLSLTIMLLAVLNMTGRSAVNVALPFLVRDHASASVISLGALYSLFSLGSLAGASALGILTPAKCRGILLYSGLSAAGVLTMMLGLATTMPALGGLMCGLGATLAFSQVLWDSLLQAKIAGAMLGRISGINLFGVQSLLPLGFVLVGSATDVWGASAVFVVCGGLMFSAALVGLSCASIRTLS